MEIYIVHVWSKFRGRFTHEMQTFRTKKEATEWIMGHGPGSCDIFRVPEGVTWGQWIRGTYTDDADGYSDGQTEIVVDPGAYPPESADFVEFMVDLVGPVHAIMWRDVV